VVQSATQTATDQMPELVGSLRGPRVKAEVREGPVARQLALAARERNAEMIVVGAHAPRGKLRALLPLTAERLVQESDVPVLIARDMNSEPPSHILAAVNHSPLSQNVLCWSRTMSELLDARVTALHVVSDAYYELASQVYGSLGEAAMKAHARAAATKWLEEQVDAAGFAPERAQARVKLGDARFEILAAERGYHTDLTVLGSQGAGSVRGRLLGGVVITLLRAGGGSILVLPAHARARARAR
jgi:nucleotide-binding universal stress UspA family protein